MMSPKPRPGIAAIEPYVGGRAQAPGGVRTIKLSANETPLGASPRAVAAFQAAAGELALYPDGGAMLLRAAIARQFGLEAERIVCGNGSDELFHLLAQAYLGPGDEILHSAHGFLVYPIAARAAGADVVVVPEPALRVDVEAILARVGPRTRAVMIANPNNPTGSYLGEAEILRLCRGLRPDILLVLDAAYAEYVRANDYEAGIALVRAHGNVVMTRTFSKAYGLAALRLGWAYCPPGVAETLNRIRSPFNVSIPAQRAGMAALTDQAHIARAVAHNERERTWLAAALGALGLDVLPSVANFLLIRFPAAPGRDAAAADACLARQGLLLRRMEAYGLPDCLRLTVGRTEANRAVVAALARFMEGSP